MRWGQIKGLFAASIAVKAFLIAGKNSVDLDAGNAIFGSIY